MKCKRRYKAVNTKTMTRPENNVVMDFFDEMISSTYAPTSWELTELSEELDDYEIMEDVEWWTREDRKTHLVIDNKVLCSTSQDKYDEGEGIVSPNRAEYHGNCSKDNGVCYNCKVSAVGLNYLEE